MISTLMVSAVLPSATWTLVAGGDIMLNAVKPSAETFKEVKAYLKEADVTYGNLEIPLTTSKTATTKKSAAEVKARSQFILKADPNHASYLSDAGFDLMSLGNNHTMDYGVAGYKETVALLKKFDIKFSGAGMNWKEATDVTAYENPEGVKVGMISYLSFLTPQAMRKCDPAGQDKPGIATLTLGGASGKKEVARVKAIVDRAKASCDFLIVALHWGAEKQPQPRPYQVTLGRLFIDQGADIVIGNHAHVLQPGELYKGKPIVYSIGNLVSPTPARSALYQFTFSNSKMTAVEILPTKIEGGKIKRLSAKETTSRMNEIYQQELTFQKLFKNPNSRPLLKR